MVGPFSTAAKHQIKCYDKNGTIGLVWIWLGYDATAREKKRMLQHRNPQKGTNRIRLRIFSYPFSQFQGQNILITQSDWNHGRKKWNNHQINTIQATLCLFEISLIYMNWIPIVIPSTIHEHVDFSINQWNGFDWLTTTCGVTHVKGNISRGEGNQS